MYTLLRNMGSASDCIVRSQEQTNYNVNKSCVCSCFAPSPTSITVP